jgi:hypothetical protein
MEVVCHHDDHTQGCEPRDWCIGVVVIDAANLAKPVTGLGAASVLAPM